MTKLAASLTLACSLALAACGGAAEEASTTNEADDFAARINSGTSSSPSVAEPLPGAQQGGNPTQPAKAAPALACSAELMGPFLGKLASDDVRAQIMEAASSVQEVRFIAPGSDFVSPDPTHPRLNIMVDVSGVIRDARCG